MVLLPVGLFTSKADLILHAGGPDNKVRIFHHVPTGQELKQNSCRQHPRDTYNPDPSPNRSMQGSFFHLSLHFVWVLGESTCFPYGARWRGNWDSVAQTCRSSRGLVKDTPHATSALQGQAREWLESAVNFSLGDAASWTIILNIEPSAAHRLQDGDGSLAGLELLGLAASHPMPHTRRFISGVTGCSKAFLRLKAPIALGG